MVRKKSPLRRKTNSSMPQRMCPHLAPRSSAAAPTGHHPGSWGPQDPPGLGCWWRATHPHPQSPRRGAAHAAAAEDGVLRQGQQQRQQQRQQQGQQQGQHPVSALRRIRVRAKEPPKRRQTRGQRHSPAHPCGGGHASTTAAATTTATTTTAVSNGALQTCQFVRDLGRSDGRGEGGMEKQSTSVVSLSTRTVNRSYHYDDEPGPFLTPCICVCVVTVL